MDKKSAHLKIAVKLWPPLWYYTLVLLERNAVLEARVQALEAKIEKRSKGDPIPYVQYRTL
jgi:hypothetical protein